MKCAQCGSPKVQSWVEGKPYCNTHYRATREKIRNETIIKLIPNIEKALARNPELLDEEDKKALERLKNTYQVLKPRRAQGRDGKDGKNALKSIQKFADQPEHGDELIAQLIGSLDRDKLIGLIAQHLVVNKKK